MVLFLVLLITFVSQVYWQNLFQVADLLPAERDQIFNQNQWWRAFTAVLIHSDLGHYLNNLYMFIVFGFFCFSYFGAFQVPLLTFLGAGFVNLMAIATYPKEVNLLGASGWVYLLGGLWLTLYLLIQRQYSYTSRILRVVGVSLMMFFPTTFVPTTSYRTHAIGFIAGVAIAVIYFVINKKWIRSFEVWQVDGIFFDIPSLREQRSSSDEFSHSNQKSQQSL